jgi:hypothetical protein
MIPAGAEHDSEEFLKFLLGSENVTQRNGGDAVRRFYPVLDLKPHRLADRRWPERQMEVAVHHHNGIAALRRPVVHSRATDDLRYHRVSVAPPA